MGARGPQPVDVKRLQVIAHGWATVLLGLRDGAKGTALKPRITLHVIETWGPNARSEANKALLKLQGEGYRIGWQVFPAPEIWQQLKEARSRQTTKASISLFRKWCRRECPNPTVESTLRELEVHPTVFLKAKRLQNYPRRPGTNDDKRILFFAKVFAGLQSNLAPVTATKKLSHWKYDNTPFRTVLIRFVDAGTKA